MRDHLRVVENILISYLEGNLDHTLECYSIVSKKDNSQLIRILSVIEDEVPKLDFNVNFKLWLDSLFAKLIGG